MRLVERTLRTNVNKSSFVSVIDRQRERKCWVKVGLAAFRRKLVPPNTRTSITALSFRLRRHVLFYTPPTAIARLHVSFVPLASVTCFTAINLDQRHKIRHRTSSHACTHTLRAVADRLPPPRFAADCTLQLPPRTTHRRSVPPADRGYRPEANSTRR